MSWDPTPWVIRGGRHSAEVARQLVYATTSGSEGVIQPGDLRVYALPVPGSKVRVDPGPCIIVNRSPGAARQSYVGRNAVAHDVDIAATGSGGGRRDMVIARIEDPQYEGQEPEDYTTAQFIFTRVLQNVPASAIASLNGARDYIRSLNISAIPLAGINIPASTATITNDMIVNLRKIALPRKQRNLFSHALTMGQTDILQATGVNGEIWPDAPKWMIDVPEWAVVVDIAAIWGQVKIPPGYATGLLWVRIGDLSDPNHMDSQTVSWTTEDAVRTIRQTYTAADRRLVPAGLRGKNVPVRLVGRVLTGVSSDVQPRLDEHSSVSCDIEFQETSE